jgi:hypothetical protein
MTENSQQKPTKFTLEQDNYIEWLALPVGLRVPKTKSDYAELIKRNRSTLWDWEQLQGFDDERRNRIKRWQRESTPDIIEKLKQNALNGDNTASRIWLEWVEGIENKLQLEHVTKEPINIKFIRDNGNNKTGDVDGTI